MTHFGSFPLTRRHAQHYYQGRVILLGDAAHPIHPLAGRGLILALQDVACLVDLWNSSQQKKHKILATKQLQQYERKRLCDNTLMQSTMDLFYAGLAHRTYH